MQVTAKNLNISYFSSTSEDYEFKQIIVVGDLIGGWMEGKILDYGSNAQRAIINETGSRDFKDLDKLDLLDFVGSWPIVYNQKGDLFISVGTASPSAYVPFLGFIQGSDHI